MTMLVCVIVQISLEPRSGIEPDFACKHFLYGFQRNPRRYANFCFIRSGEPISCIGAFSITSRFSEQRAVSESNRICLQASSLWVPKKPEEICRSFYYQIKSGEPIPCNGPYTIRFSSFSDDCPLQGSDLSFQFNPFLVCVKNEIRLTCSFFSSSAKTLRSLTKYISRN